MKWKPTIAVSTACFDGYPIDVALQTLSSLDGISIELAYIAGYVDNFSEELFSDDHVRTVRKLLDENDLTCTAVSAHTDLSTDGGLDRGLRRIRFGAGVGAERVVTNAAIVENERVFRENLDVLAREAELCQIDLLLENPGDGYENVVNDGATAAQFATAFLGSRIGVNYDFGNVISHFREAVEPESDWLSVRHLVRYFHLKDVIREGDCWRYPELGTGMIDYNRILPMIAEDQAVNALGLELPLRLRRSAETPNGKTDTPLAIDEIMHIVKRSKDYLSHRIDHEESDN